MMCALKVTRSTIAATSRWSPNTLPHSSERKVGPDPDRGVFVPLGDDLEQQFGAARVDLHVAESCRAATGYGRAARGRASMPDFVARSGPAYPGGAPGAFREGSRP